MAYLRHGGHVCKYKDKLLPKRHTNGGFLVVFQGRECNYYVQCRSRICLNKATTHRLQAKRKLLLE